MNPEKYTILIKQIVFLGHAATEDGIKTDPH